MVFLADKDNHHVLQYKSYKSRRVVRYPLAAETHALAYAADASILIQHELKILTSRPFPITLLTDSKSLFDVISKGSDTSEKILMVDISATRQAYDQEVIDGLGWIRRDFNIADSMTKVNDIMKNSFKRAK